MTGAVSSNGVNVLVATWILTFFACLTIAGRFFARRHALTASDFLSLNALIFALGYSATTTFQVTNGYGQQANGLDTRQLQYIRIAQVPKDMLNSVSVFFIRTSICMCLCKLARDNCGLVMHWLVWFTCILNIIALVSTLVYTGVNCIPIQGLWDFSLGASCIGASKLAKLQHGFGAINSLADITLVALSFHYVLESKLSRKARIASTALLTLGLATVGVSLGKIDTSEAFPADPSHSTIKNTYFTLLEMYFGIIAASLSPIWKAIFRSSSAEDLHLSTPSRMSLVTSRLPFTQGFTVSAASRPQSSRSNDVEAATGDTVIVKETDVTVELDRTEQRQSFSDLQRQWFMSD